MKTQKNAKTELKRAALDMMKKSIRYPFKVTELCRRAHINRSTFYQYYSSADGLMDEMILAYLTDLNGGSKINYWSASRNAYQKHMAEILCRMREDSSLFLLFMKPEYFSLYEKAMYSYYTEGIIHPLDPCVKKYENLFQISGGLRVIHEWIRDGSPIPPDELAQYLTERFLRSTDSTPFDPHR